MGLGGVEKMENLKSYSGNPNPIEFDLAVGGLSEIDLCTNKLAALGTGDNSSDMQLLLQVCALLN